MEKKMNQVFKLDFASMPGGYYRVIITDETTNHVRYLTSICGDLSNTEERRHILDAFLGRMGSSPIAYILRQRMFPKDTMIADMKETEHGVVWTNPRYPSQDEPTETNKTTADNPKPK